MPIASCESLFGRRQFRPFFENRSIDVSIIDVPWNGFAQSRKVADLAETDLDTVVATIAAERPDVCVIDSVQTLWSDTLEAAPGSVAQVRECAALLTRFAKQSGTVLILVGHVTKDGSLAGPKLLEHVVDTRGGGSDGGGGAAPAR